MLSSEECGIRINVSVSIAEALKLSPPKGLELLGKGMRKATEGRYEAIAALTSLKRSGGWRELGASSLEQLANKVAGISDHVFYDMLRVGKALLRNPEVDLAFRSGRISWCKVRALVPVVTPKNAGGWIEQAERMTVNKLEHEVGRQREPYTVEHLVPMFQVPKAVLERYKRLAAKARAIKGQKDLDDVECLEAIFEAAEAAWAEPEKPSLSNTRHIPRRTLRKLWTRARNRCEQCGNVHSLEAHHIVPVSEGGTHELSNLLLLCSLCHSALHARRRCEKSAGEVHESPHGENGPNPPATEVRESRPSWNGGVLSSRRLPRSASPVPRSPPRDRRIDSFDRGTLGGGTEPPVPSLDAQRPHA